MRIAAQLLVQGKNTFADSTLDLQLPRQTSLRVNGSDERIETLLSTGFSQDTVTPGLMGDGIYMTTDLAANMDWGSSQAVGGLTSDIKIMDLYSTGKRSRICCAS